MKASRDHLLAIQMKRTGLQGTTVAAGPAMASRIDPGRQSFEPGAKRMHKYFRSSNAKGLQSPLRQRKEYGSPLTGRVLIVEDDHATQLLLEALLEHESIEAERAGDGQTALQKLEERDFAAVILDLLMPRTNGFDVLRNIAARKPEILKRIIVITAAAEPAWHSCRELNRVRCLLLKPLDIMEVVGHVRACMAKTSEAGSDVDGDVPVSHVSHG